MTLIRRSAQGNLTDLKEVNEAIARALGLAKLSDNEYDN